MGQMIEVGRPDGGKTPAYLAPSPRTGSPAIVLVQEWWGLNDHIRSVSDRLAAEGYTVLAPDLYRGRATTQADEAHHLMDSLDFADAIQQDIAGCVIHLAEGGRKVGVTGFCMGGALTVAAAALVPGLSAAVCFYGIPPSQVADPALIRIPFMGHFATLDTWCTPAAAASLEADMRAVGQSPEVHHYVAQHAFFNDSRRAEVYDAACAELAWSRTTAFFARHLGG
ncbi:dienelactone hydrolase family protein [Aquabacterium parvum]|uniref:dienelactone hydrolase family protein n=1 Tax=Aquabacterium parvum TaxID=70584 RepID=UPI000718BA52|nr:dienelactone hydrolase family protein [Aquabacterium parvum]MBU0914995.1 dienelactone hydrolase family protein [Gammaproteobacteria bacterium]